MENNLLPMIPEERLVWQAYKPDDRNMEIRDKIEQLSTRTLQDHGPLKQNVKDSFGSISGFVFLAGMLALFVATYKIFF